MTLGKSLQRNRTGAEPDREQIRVRLGWEQEQGTGGTLSGALTQKDSGDAGEEDLGKGGITKENLGYDTPVRQQQGRVITRRRGTHRRWTEGHNGGVGENENEES